VGTFNIAGELNCHKTTAFEGNGIEAVRIAEEELTLCARDTMSPHTYTAYFVLHVSHIQTTDVTVIYEQIPHQFKSVNKRRKYL
jgi:hypothetical protein